MIGLCLALLLQTAATGAIEGRVTDSQGKLVGAAEVQALAVSYENGRRKLTLAESARTNDLGEYRLFWLPPGLYALAVVSPPGRGIAPAAVVVPALTSPGNALDSPLRQTRPASQQNTGIIRTTSPGEYETYYHRGVTDPDKASLVIVRPGADTGADIEIAWARLNQVRGEIVVETSGRLVPEAQVKLSGSTTSHASTASSAQGAFIFRYILPGDQALFATASIGSSTFLGRQTVQVGDADVINARITLMPALAISGRIVIEGQQPGQYPKPDRLSIQLLVTPQDRVSPVPGASPVADGSFALKEIIPGVDYTVRVSLPPEWRDAYVKSVHLDGLDVLNGGFRAEKQPDRPLEVVINGNGGTIDGRARNGATVVLVPDFNHRRRHDLYKFTSPDTSGQFHLEGIAPGDYALFAWEDTPKGAWQDPQFMSIFEGRGIPIHINEGSALTLDLPLISEGR